MRVGAGPVTRPGSVRSCRRASWIARNRASQRSSAASSAEQDEERVVAGERALLLGHRRLVDRLGDDAGGPGRAGEDEDQAAPPDRHRDVGEDPAEPLVGRGSPRAGEGLAGDDVDVAVAAHDLDQAELRDVAAHRRLGHREAARPQLLGELFLAGD